jgi:dimethylaniline monooxygenase (N-oxide forming)
MRATAIIGAGPGGLVAARWLKKEGFEPVLFERGNRVGGQWTGDPRYSGVWPSMRTNTSHMMTAFSDLAHSPGTSVHPSNQAVCAYLQRYAEQFDLLPSVRLRTEVRGIARAGSGWVVRFTDGDDARREEIYSNVVVATGRFRKPAIPAVPGLSSFSGPGGIAHTFQYKDTERYRGRRVLVAGCSVSALEIASDLAMTGAARVISANRRQRYVVQKIIAGVPTDHLAFTRFAALAAESLPVEVVARNLKEFITRTCGSPEQYGAPKPADNILDAGFAACQHFLPLVAEGRIEIRPWMAGIDGRMVRFADGTSEEVDAVIFGTGYDLDLPFLSEDIRRTLDVDARHVDLHEFTFHPDLPGLAFLGIHQQIGPQFPSLELQSRWIAYVWSGARPAPSREEMEAGLAMYRARRGGPQDVPMHVAAIHFARGAGVEPEVERWPELARALLFGPLSAVSFRLSGRDSLPDAPQRTAEVAASQGAVPMPEFTPDQRAQLQALAAARKDASLASVVERLTGPGAPAWTGLAGARPPGEPPPGDLSRQSTTVQWSVSQSAT